MIGQLELQLAKPAFRGEQPAGNGHLHALRNFHRILTDA
jgi:hypothetical protein